MFTHKFFSLFYLRPNMVFFGHFVHSRSVNTYIHALMMKGRVDLSYLNTWSTLPKNWIAWLGVRRGSQKKEWAFSLTNYCCIWWVINSAMMTVFSRAKAREVSWHKLALCVCPRSPAREAPDLKCKSIWILGVMQHWIFFITVFSAFQTSY